MLLIRDIPNAVSNYRITLRPDNGPNMFLDVNLKLEPGKIMVLVSLEDTEVMVGRIIYDPARQHLKIQPVDQNGFTRLPSVLGRGWPEQIEFGDWFAIALSQLLDNARTIYGTDLEQLYSFYQSLYGDDEEPPLSFV